MEDRLRTAALAWRRRRVSVSGLTRDAQVLIGLGFVACLGSIFVLLSIGFLRHVPGGADASLDGNGPYPGSGPLPRVAYVVVLLGIASACSLFMGVRHGRRFVDLLIAVGIGFLGLAIALAQTSAARLVRQAALDLELPGRPDPRRAFLALALTWTAVAFVGIFLVVTVLRDRVPRWAAPVSAAIPFLVLVAAYGVAPVSGHDFVVDVEQFVRPGGLTADGAIPFTAPKLLFGYPLVVLVLQLAVAVTILVLWQTVAGTRGLVRDVAPRVARPVSTRPRLLAVCLIKAGLVVAGLAAVLPGPVSELWAASRRDGLLDWLVAALVIPLITMFVLYLRRASPTHGETRAAAIFLGVFILLDFVVALVVVTSVLLQGISFSTSLTVLRSAGEIQHHVTTAEAVGTLACLPLGILMLRKSRHRWAGGFLIAAAVWSLPRSIGILRDPAGIASTPGAFSFATADALITFAVLALVVSSPWIGIDARRWTPLLATILAVSTVAALAGPAIDRAPERLGRYILYIGLVFPFVWQFLFDAENLNRRRPSREGRVLVAVGLATFTLAIASFQLATESGSDLRSLYGQLGNTLILGPLVIFLLAETSIMRRRAERLAHRSTQTERAREVG
jgi:hypothetical protein